MNVYLLIHGNSGSAKDMEYIASLVPNDSVIYNFDLPCHGENEDWISPLSIEYCTDFVIKRLPDNASKITVIGYSDGANIAMNLLNVIEGRIHRVILLSPNISWLGLVKWFRILISFIGVLSNLVPGMKKTKERMRMMRNYKYEGKMEIDIPCDLYFAQNDVVTQNEQKNIGNIFRLNRTIISNTTHFNICKNVELAKKIRQTIAST